LVRESTHPVAQVARDLGIPDKVDRWRTSNQQQRWVASALLAIEPRLRRL